MSAGDASLPQIVQLVETAVQQAGKAIADTASARPELRGMGTTLTMLLACGDRAVVAHVGDSRLYRLRADRAELITHDHTVEAELDRRGIAMDDAVRQSRMAKMLTRSLGERDTVSVESHELPLEAGDVLILCSDGLSHYLQDGSELIKVSRSCALRDLPQRLIDLAISRGGGDNVTVVAACVEADRPVAQHFAAEQTTEYVIPGFDFPLSEAPDVSAALRWSTNAASKTVPFPSLAGANG